MKFRKTIALLLAVLLIGSLAPAGSAAEYLTVPFQSGRDVLRQSAVPVRDASPLPGRDEPMTATDCTIMPSLTDVDRGIVQNAAVTFDCYFAAENCGVKDTVLGIEIYPEADPDGDSVYHAYYYFYSGSQAGTQRFSVPSGTFGALGRYEVYFNIISLDHSGMMSEVLKSVYLTVNVVDHAIPLEELSLKDAEAYASVSSLMLLCGEAQTLCIALTPSAYTGSREIEIKNPNPEIVEVQEALGYLLFTPKQPGETTLRFSCGGVQLSFPVTVRQRITSISTDEAVSLCVGVTRQLYYSAGDSSVNSYIQTQTEAEDIAAIVGRDIPSGALWLKGVAPGTTNLIFSGDDYTKKVPVTVYANHELVEIRRVEATCTASGTLERECIHCGTVVTEEIPSPGHKVDPETAEKVQAPTATQPGFVMGRCTRCGQEALTVLPPIFIDTVADSFYAQAVDDLYARGIIKGMTENSFGPGISINRGQLVVLLYRLSGESAEAAEVPFRDVSADSFVYDAVCWAAANGIAQGYGDGTFLPGQPVTRAEMVTFLYRFARHMGADMQASADLSSYTDVDQVLPYAQAPFAWAVASNLIKGTSAATLGPGETANRAQCAVILYRYIQSFPSAAN